MPDDLIRKLRAIQEGAVEDIEDTENEDLEEVNEEDLDDETLAEVNLAILEAELGPELLQDFVTENASSLVRDGILTESAAGGAAAGPQGRSYIVLSPQARRQKAINILKLRMAREAGDPRYKKLVIARKLVKRLLEQIRSDGRYKKAEAIVRKQRFKVVNNPQAAAAMKRAQKTKLQ